MQVDDISYNEDQPTKYLTMQLLARLDGKKWCLWVKSGKLSSETFNAWVHEFYDRYEAMADFEQLFYKKTGNKWTERAFFKQKPGMYMLIRKESEQEEIKKFKDLEESILRLISTGFREREP